MKSISVPQTVLTRFEKKDSAIVFNLRGEDCYYEIFGPAVEVWQELTTGADVSKLITKLSKKNNVDPKIYKAQFDRFILQLKKLNLIEVQG